VEGAILPAPLRVTARPAARRSTRFDILVIAIGVSGSEQANNEFSATRASETRTN
jgi:hypothetical protein